MRLVLVVKVVCGNLVCAVLTP
ncbi:DUF3265 domain-containing protein [Vibrio vulnificus]|nr:DUF3265 domain-containing protein [Vibrio vulnificus]MDK2622636.1 DUF3265 domain-containing protein [Vibrio vulnificus]